MAFIRCPQCNTVIEKPATGEPVCPSCGFGAPKAAPKKAAKKAATKTSAKATAAAPPPPAWEPAPTAPPVPPPSPSAKPPSPYATPSAFSPPSESLLQRNSGKAVAALVLGIVGCCIWVVPFIGPFLALPSGILALVFGILGAKEVKRDPVTFKGKGLAITGIVLGSIMIFVGILLIIAFTVGIGAIEDYCRENPDTEGCDDFNDEAAQDGGSLLDRVARVPVVGAFVTPLRLPAA